MIKKPPNQTTIEIVIQIRRDIAEIGHKRSRAISPRRLMWLLFVVSSLHIYDYRITDCRFHINIIRSFMSFVYSLYFPHILWIELD